MGEFLVELFIKYILSFPGALIRWIFLGGRKPIKDLLKDGWDFNAGITAGFFAIVVLVLKCIK